MASVASKFFGFREAMEAAMHTYGEEERAYLLEVLKGNASGTRPYIRGGDRVAMETRRCVFIERALETAQEFDGRGEFDLKTQESIRASWRERCEQVTVGIRAEYADQLKALDVRIERVEEVVNASIPTYEEEARACLLDSLAVVRAGGNPKDEMSRFRRDTKTRRCAMFDAAIGPVVAIETVEVRAHISKLWKGRCESVNVRIRAEHDDIFEVAKKFEEAEHKAAVKELKKANRRRGLEAVPVTPPVPVVVAAPVAAVPTAPDTTAVDLEVELANQAARRLKSVTPKTVRKLTVPEPPAVGAPVAPGDITPDETRRVERRRLRDTARIEARRHRENEQRQKAKNEYNTVRNALGASFAVERLQPVSDPIAVIEQGLSAALAADAKRVKAKAKAQASAEARAEAEEVHTCIFR